MSCQVLQEMLQTGRSADRDGNTVVVRGLSTVNNLIVLDNLQQQLKPQHTLEIGLAFGASALVLSQGHRNSGAPGVGQHVAIDPYQGDLNFAGLAALERAGLRGYLHHVPLTSDRALPALLEQGRQFGLVYVDGSHLFEDVFIDCHYAAQLLPIGGVMAMDDSSDPNIAKAIRFMRRNLNQLLEEIDLSAYRQDRGRGLRYRAAKMLGRIQLCAFRKKSNARRPYDARLAAF